MNPTSTLVLLLVMFITAGAAPITKDKHGADIFSGQPNTAMNITLSELETSLKTAIHAEEIKHIVEIITDKVTMNLTFIVLFGVLQPVICVVCAFGVFWMFKSDKQTSMIKKQKYMIQSLTTTKNPMYEREEPKYMDCKPPTLIELMSIMIKNGAPQPDHPPLIPPARPRIPHLGIPNLVVETPTVPTTTTHHGSRRVINPDTRPQDPISSWTTRRGLHEHRAHNGRQSHYLPIDGGNSPSSPFRAVNQDSRAASCCNLIARAPPYSGPEIGGGH